MQSYQPFLDGGVNAAIEFTPFTGAAAAVGGATDPADTGDPAVTTDPGDTGTDAPAVTEEGEAGYVNAEDVNFRDAPNTDGGSLGKQALNTKLRILGEEDGWYKVKIGDKTGYIRSDFVTKGDPS